MQKKRFKLAIIIIILLIAIYPFGDPLPVKYINRKTGKTETEKIYGENWLRWLYNNPFGELSLYAIIKRKFVSEIYGKRMDKLESANKIKDFIKNYDINMSDFEDSDYKSFNDFFTRKLKAGARQIDTAKNVIISPADGKILAYQNIDKQNFIVKGYKFNLQKFLQDSLLSKKYKSGSLMIIRLCPTDYHRYHFPFSGEIIKQKKISGDLYSVSPIALRKKIEIICENKRQYTEIKTKLGDYIMAEVGATMVGSIINTYKFKQIKKAQEKGYFKFGGSTIILIFEKNKIIIDKDLILNTEKGFETEVKMGEKIAVSSLDFEEYS